MWNSIRQALTLGPRFRSHARKPGLEVYFDPTSTYERRDVADTGDRPGYFCHVMVRNDGPVAARNCRGRLLEIQVRGADGRTSPAPGFFAPVFLKWAREPDFDAREVEGNQVRRLDLCFALASAPDQLRFFAPPSPSGVMIFPPGVYTLNVQVTADDVKPANAMFQVDFTSGWDRIVVSEEARPV
ncbi:MAG TPA: hypothetical protein VKN16_28010 [Methylomirabilota bacterium]|nr:hypothetical protein [Methylomirabilota bacterium]